MDYRPLAKPSSAQEVLKVRSKRVRRESPRDVCPYYGTRSRTDTGQARGDNPIEETAPAESRTPSAHRFQ